MIEIRPASEADDDFLYALNRQTLGEVMGPVGRRDPARVT
jgi:hypothetical protein